MMKHLKVVLFGLLTATLIFASIPSIGQTKDKNQGKKGPSKAEAKAEKSRGGGEDPNITTKEAPNSPDAAEKNPAPPSKGGEKARGRAFAIGHVDNRTPLHVKVYLDGTYRGTVPPWGDLRDVVEAGETRFYCRADYTDGTYSYWGPRVIYCPPGQEGTYTITQ